MREKVTKEQIEFAKKLKIGGKYIMRIDDSVSLPDRYIKEYDNRIVIIDYIVIKDFTIDVGIRLPNQAFSSGLLYSNEMHILKEYNDGVMKVL